MQEGSHGCSFLPVYLGPPTSFAALPSPPPNEDKPKYQRFCGAPKPPSLWYPFAGWNATWSYANPTTYYTPTVVDVSPPTGQHNAFHSFDAWCRATDTTARNMETFLPTYDPSANPVQPPTVVRFSIEVADRTTWTSPSSNQPLDNSNVQTFFVIVKGLKFQ